MKKLTLRFTIWTMMMALFAISMATVVVETRRGAPMHQASRSFCAGGVNSCDTFL